MIQNIYALISLKRITDESGPDHPIGKVGVCLENPGVSGALYIIFLYT